MGVFDKVGDCGARCGDGGRNGEVQAHPAAKSDTSTRWQPFTEQVEVAPPNSHADHQPENTDGNCRRVVIGGIAHPSDDADDHFAQDDDRKKAETFDERFGNPVTKARGPIG